MKEQKRYMKELQKKVTYSNHSHLVQLILQPLTIVRYLLLTRLALLINRSIPGTAKLFTGQLLSGFFPEPVFSYLYLYGFCEEDLTKIFFNYLKKGKTFLDVGSHIGYYSVLASKIVGSRGKIYAFEPTPSTFDLLVNNTKNSPNINCYPFAAWSRSKDLVFRDYGQFYSGCNSFTEARMPQKYLQKSQPTIRKVRAISLDEFCKTHKVRPDFIKIDAESAEFEVLTGMKSTIKKFRPIITIEIGDTQINPKKGTKSCIYMLEKLGYTAYDMHDGAIKKHILQKSYHLIYNNLLLLPKDR